MSGSRTYAQVDDFVDYAEQEVWEEYIQETVVPLWETAWQLKECHKDCGFSLTHPVRPYPSAGTVCPTLP